MILVVVIVGMLVGWRLAGPSETETELGRVAFNVYPSLNGEAEAYVPLADWGMRADAFDAPLKLKAEIRALDRPGLLTAAGGDPDVLTATEDELRSGAQAAILRTLAYGVAVTILLGVAVALVWRSRRRRGWIVAWAAIGSVAFAAFVIVLAERTFDPQSFEHPTYYARGSELAQILTLVERERERSGYSTTVERALRGFSAYLAGSGQSGAEQTRELVLASDLHNNAMMLDPLESYVGKRPLLFAGDAGQDGNEAEVKTLAGPIAAISDRVIAVSGNHDSEALMNGLDAAGATVLDERSGLGRVAGLTVAGYDDPLVWKRADGPADNPGRIFSFNEMDDSEQLYRQAERRLFGWFDGLERKPDIVLVHQNGLAQALARHLWRQGYAEPLTILTGHDHKQHIDRYGQIVVVDGGTVGAGGLFGAGEEFVGLAQLHFDAAEPVLRSVDLIRIEPLSGQAQAERVVIDSLCPDASADRCSVEPQSLQAAVISPPGE